MDLNEKVVWSPEAYSLAELKRSRFTYPLLVKSDCGLYGNNDYTTVSTNQIMLLHQWEESERVVAKNRKNELITIPTDHPHKVEVYLTNRIPSKVGLFSVQNVLRNFKPPVLARFDPNKVADFYIGHRLLSSRDFGLFTLESVHYLEYMKASAIDDEGRISKEYISVIPLNVEMEFFVARGLKGYHRDDLRKLLTDYVQETARILDEATHVYTYSGIMEFENTMEEDYIRLDQPKFATWGRKKLQSLRLPPPQKPFDPPFLTNRTVCVVKPTTTVDLPDTCIQKSLPKVNPQLPISREHCYNTTTRIDIDDHGYEEIRDYALDRAASYYNLDSEGQAAQRDDERKTADYYNDTHLYNTGITGRSEYSNFNQGQRSHKNFWLASTPSRRRVSHSKRYQCDVEYDDTALSKSQANATGSHKQATGCTPKIQEELIREDNTRQNIHKQESHVLYEDNPRQSSANALSTANVKWDDGFSEQPTDRTQQAHAEHVNAGYQCKTIHSLEQAPRDLSKLGVSEVCDVLYHLQLGRFINRFKEKKVDGYLLVNCTEEELMQEFCIGRVAMSKLQLFIQGTGRPTDV